MFILVWSSYWKQIAAISATADLNSNAERAEILVNRRWYLNEGM